MFEVEIQVDACGGLWHKTMKLPFAPFPGLTIENTAFDDGYCEILDVYWCEETHTITAVSKASSEDASILMDNGWVKRT